VILTWITTLITFLIGYALGVNSQTPEKAIKLREELGLKLRRAKRKLGKGRVGGISKLTAQEQVIRNNPTLKAEEEEMTKVLDDVL